METTAGQSNLDTLIADFKQEENKEIQFHHELLEDTGQILEVFEISDVNCVDIAYEEAKKSEDSGEEPCELMNDIADSEEHYEIFEETTGSPIKMKIMHDISGIKHWTPKKIVDQETMDNAIKEIFSNRSR